ncbi:MAG: acyl-CoA reductase [Bacteroidetes bacterium]|jgi:hypothetical protein|nr:acyl-CoA reductase [Bacteroidota bacterium]
MSPKQRLNSFVQLRDYLNDYLSGNKAHVMNDTFDVLNAKIHDAFLYNGWFTEENTRLALTGITQILEPAQLEKALKKTNKDQQAKTIALIMAGNIPAVGFHDLLCVLLCGHKALIKLSSDDTILIPFLMEILLKIEPGFADQIAYAENRLSNFDAVIATGSNNSAGYFNYYFGKYPHIIRKNRNSVAVLTGTETTGELAALGHDVFDYYGLGCRNVSKLFVPEGYVMDGFFESIFSFGAVIDNKKYGNNYEYNRAIYLMTQQKFLDNNFVVIKQDTESLSSPVGVILYDTYTSLPEVEKFLLAHSEQLQCIVSKAPFEKVSTIGFGQSQCPGFFDYADGVDVIAFLNTL